MIQDTLLVTAKARKNSILHARLNVGHCVNIRRLLSFRPKNHIEFLWGRAYIPGMEMQGVMARVGVLGVQKAGTKQAADRRQSELL